MGFGEWWIFRVIPFKFFLRENENSALIMSKTLFHEFKNCCLYKCRVYIIIQEIIKSSNAKERFYFSIEIIDGKNFSFFFYKIMDEISLRRMCLIKKMKWNHFEKTNWNNRGYLNLLNIVKFNDLKFKRTDPEPNWPKYQQFILKKKEILNKFNVLFYL